MSGDLDDLERLKWVVVLSPVVPGSIRSGPSNAPKQDLGLSDRRFSIIREVISFLRLYSDAEGVSFTERGLHLPMQMYLCISQVVSSS